MTKTENENIPQTPNVETKKASQKKQELTNRKKISARIIEDKIIHTKGIFRNSDNQNDMSDKKRCNNNFEETKNIQLISFRYLI